MLKIEDCKPGVEVIAIKNTPQEDIRPQLATGMIYTIKEFGYSYPGNKPCVVLHEVDNTTAKPYKCWGYFLWQFKLRNSEELVDLLLTTSLNAEGPLRRVAETVEG